MTEPTVRACLEVPQPLYDVDAELNLMAMLEHVMRVSAEILTEEEVRRVSAWFSDRYNPNPTE